MTQTIPGSTARSGIPQAPPTAEFISGGHLGPLGTLGVGIPFVLAAKHARPDKEVVALFAQMLGGYGEEVRDPADIRPALQRARESGLPSLTNVWVDPDVHAPGTMNQTMYK
jgi:thiamine pyrophosphate-dependent acetolactate synthase large subunit-like protein